MALRFGAAITDVVTASSNAVLDNLDASTILAWVMPTTLTANRNVFNKGIGTSNNRRNNIFVSNSGDATQLQTVLDRATSDLTYRSATGALELNRWCFVAATFNANASAGNIIKHYVGRLDTPAAYSTNGSPTDGSGAFQSDSGVAPTIGNNSGVGAGWQGLIDTVALVRGELSVDQIRAWQQRTRPDASPAFGWIVVPGVVGQWRCGSHGNRVVIDESGYGNHGLVTGAVLVSDVQIASRFFHPVPSIINPNAAAGQPLVKRYSGIPHMRRGSVTFGHGWSA